MLKSLNILHTVEFYLPHKNGMSEVVRQISEQLVDKGHSVTVATGFHPSRGKNIINNGVNVISFNITGSYVNGYVGEVDEYENYLLNSNFDVITNFAAQQWATDIVLSLLDKLNAKLFFVPTGFSMLYNENFKNYYNLMPVWLSKYNAKIFTSEYYQDYFFAINNKIVNNFIIPNGASKSEFEREISFDIRKHLQIHNNTKIILHVGSYTGIKGHLQALKIFLKSNIESNIHLIFIGSNLNPLESRDLFLFLFWWRHFNFRDFLSIKKIYLFINHLLFNKYLKNKNRIHFLKLTREQTVDTYKTSSLFLFPSMLECSPVVIYEALASRTPFLSTPVGNVVEIAKNSSSGIILPSKIKKNGHVYVNIKKSAILLSTIIKKDNKLLNMSELGFQFWKNNYTWESISNEYEILYKKFINNTA